MNILIEKEAMLGMLASAVRISANGNGITKNVLLRTVEGLPCPLGGKTHPATVQMVATDLETTIFLEAPATVDAPGQMLLDAAMLQKIVSGLGPGEIMLRHDPKKENHWVEVSQGKVSYNFVGQPPDEYPTDPDRDLGPENAIATIGAGRLRSAVLRVAFSASRNASRPHLCGVLVRETTATPSGGPGLVLVTSDGHRLSKVVVELARGSLGKGDSGIVPVRALAEIEAAFSQDEKLQLSIRDGRIRIASTTTSTALVSQLIDGAFPDFDRVIHPPAHRVEVDVEELATVMARMRLIVDSKNPSVSVQLGLAGAEFKAASPARGSAKINLEFRCDPADLGVNPIYIQEALKAVREPGWKTATLGFTDNLSPIILTLEQEPGCAWVIMPCRV